MNDQALPLRLGRAAAVPQAPRGGSAPETIVIGSGKGGVGKSFLAVTFAIAMAELGRRVLLVDGDQNLGNLHVLLGERPLLTPEALLQDTELTADQLVVDVVPGLRLIPADSGAESMQRLTSTDRARLHRRLLNATADADLVIVDAGAGLDGAVRCATLEASRLLIVAVPEPTALTDAYALMKVVRHRLPQLPFDLVINRTMHADETTIAHERLRTATQRFLGCDVGLLGDIPEDLELRSVQRDARLMRAPRHGTPAQRAAWQLAVHQLQARGAGAAA